MSNGLIYAGLTQPAGPAPLFRIADRERAKRVMNAWVDAQSELDGRRTFHGGRVMRATVFHRDGRQEVIRFQCQRDGTGLFGFSLASLEEDRDLEEVERIILFRSLSQGRRNSGAEVFQVCSFRKHAKKSQGENASWLNWIRTCRKNGRTRYVINVEGCKRGSDIAVSRMPDEEGETL